MKPAAKIALEALGGIICIVMAWVWLMILAGFID